MKNWRTTITALLLALVLATAAFAGEMHTGVVTPQPTPTASSTAETDATDGEMHTGEAASTPDAVTEVALSLLQSLLALF